MHPLDGAWRKVERAEEHLRSLDDEVTWLMKNKPYAIVRQPKPDGSGKSIRIERRQLPRRAKFDLISADIIHNLRSALDQIAYALAKPPTRNTAFPVWLYERGHKGRSFYGKRGREQVEHMSPEAEEALERVQPYNRAKEHDPPWLLHNLWIDDKHKIIPAIPVFNFTHRVDITPAEGTEELPSAIEMASRVGDEGDIVFDLPEAFDANIDLEPVPTLNIRFEVSARPYGGRNVIATTQWLHKYIREFVLPLFPRSWF